MPVATPPRTAQAPAPTRAAAPHRLVAVTRPTDGTDPFAFLTRSGENPRFLYWDHGQGLAATGIAAEVRAVGKDRMATLQRDAASIMDGLAHHRHAHVPANVGPRWVGGFAFDVGTGRPGFPDARFLLPRRLLTIENGQGYVTEVEPDVVPLEPAAPARESVPAMAGWESAPSFYAWAAGVRQLLQSIRQGQLEKAVIARTLTTTLARPPDVVAVSRRLAQRVPQSRVFLFEPMPGRAFLGASPELLARVHDGHLETVAIAGSRGRGLNPTQDEALERALLASSKEAWEHELVARFVRAALDARGRPWRTTSERHILKLPHVQHLATRFDAEAGPEHVLGAAARFHPTPAVAGSPPHEAAALLRTIEPVPRGWYAGAVGWFDALGQGELSVALRAAHVDGATVVLHAGCGIVEGSDPAEEWEESRAKFQLLVDEFDQEAAAA